MSTATTGQRPEPRRVSQAENKIPDTGATHKNRVERKPSLLDIVYGVIFVVGAVLTFVNGALTSGHPDLYLIGIVLMILVLFYMKARGERSQKGVPDD